MNTIKEWLNRLQRQDGLFLSKDRLIQEIRKSSKNQLPIEYKVGTGIIIVAIPVPINFQI
jgi:hypothetical protein